MKKKQIRAKKKLTNSQLKRKKKQHPKLFLRSYWHYIPLILVTTFGLVFGSVLPQTVGSNQPQTLAYSTEMSVSQLLSHTNSERTSRGLDALTINSKLNNSSGSKASHMVTNDYWAHNAPDGTSPWHFFESAGYNYQKAGENLAYGFSTSSATVTGWMNSPSHRDNMLDPDYDEVGFGFVNSSDFVNSGQQTIVVAHYGRSLGASTSKQETQQSTPQSLPATQSSQPSTPTPSPEPATEPEAPTEEPETESEPQPLTSERINQGFSTASLDQSIPVPVNISRLQQWTNGDAPWSGYALAFGALLLVMAWIVKHALLVKKYIVYGEHFVAHHPAFDAAVILIAAVAVYLTQSSGVVL